MKRLGASFKSVVLAVAVAALGATTFAAGAELETGELDMTPPVNDVSVLQGATVSDVRITVEATGPISCEITPAAPATVRVMREYTIDSAGTIKLTLLGGPRSIYAGEPLAAGDCAVAWDAPPYPEPFRVFTSVTAAADAPPGDYVVPIVAQVSSPPVSGPGLVDEVPSSFVVHVIQASRPPAVGLAAPDVVSGEGSALHVRGSFTDPDGDALALTSTPASGLFTDNGDGTWSWSLATNDERGPADVTVTATDPDGLSASDTFSYAALNVAPALAFSPANRTTIDEGTPSTAQHRYAYTVRDPGDDTVAAIHGRSCGANGALVTGSPTPPGTAGSFACRFRTAEGPLRSQVKAAATDSDGDTGEPGVQVVTIRNVPASVAIASPVSWISYPRGRLVPVIASFTDKGKFDTHTCSIDWGNGQTTRGIVVEARGVGGCLGYGAHTKAGSFQIVVTVRDDDDAVGSSAPRSIRVR